MVIFLVFNVVFSQSTYEEIRLNAADVGDKTKFLKEGMDCTVLFWNGKVFTKSITLSFFIFYCFVCKRACFSRAVFKRVLFKL